MDNLRRNKSAAASLTLEASLVLPVFLLAVILLMNLFKYADAQEHVFTVITEMAGDVSMLGILNVSSENVADNIGDIVGEKITGAIEGELGELLKKELAGFVSSGIGAVFYEAEKLFFELVSQAYFEDSLLKNKGIIGGLSGLDFTGSRIRDGNGFTDIICEYNVELSSSLFGTYSHRIKSRVKIRSFSGIACESRFPDSNKPPSENETGDDSEEGETEDDEYVYITENGKTYHKSMDCYHLKINKRPVLFSEVSSLRNENGGKYYACEHCSKKRIPEQYETVFITTDGTRYHLDEFCPGLKRSVIKVRLSEVGNRKPCKNCGY